MGHHPHYISHDPDPFPLTGGRMMFEFRPFSGDEPEPACPALPIFDLTEGDRVAHRLLRAEYEAAHNVWTVARLERDAIRLIKLIAPAYEAHVGAQGRTAELYQALRRFDQPWEQSVMRLLDSHDALLSSAIELDKVVEPLADAVTAAETHQSTYVYTAFRGIPALGAVAEVNTGEWVIPTRSEYECAVYSGTSGHQQGYFAVQAAKTIDDQKRRLREVGAAARQG